MHRHWVPFDGQQLEQALGLSAGQLEAYLYDDHRTLSELARARGVDPERLADELIAPWRPIVSAEHVAVLRGRTMRLLSQGHLAQHVFFHVYHGLDLPALAEKVFGISEPAYQALRLNRATPVDIARAHRVSEAALRAGMRELLGDDYQRGIDIQEAAPAESRRLLERQLSTLSCWSAKPLARFDASNPFGKQLRQHRGHAAGWPRTAAERALDEARVERGRQRLPASCWRRPPRWKAAPPKATQVARHARAGVQSVATVRTSAALQLVCDAR